MIIDDFMSRYEREYDYYQAVAHLCEQRCETALVQAGIRAIVTSRAKKHTRLRKKIEQRHPSKDYQTVDAIYQDIVDLAGVRIALYFPGDEEEVDKFIRAAFEVIDDKKFPVKPQESSKSHNNYEKRFSGYTARHYRVHLKAEDLADHQQHYSKACIEIQVASVLMHAWAEVEHDLAYKPLNGELSEEEYALLDQINGLVITGEIALEQLQKAVKTRVEKEGYRFSNQYDIAAYLYGHLQKKVKDSPMVMGRVDVLFLFLQSIQLDRPGELVKFIEDLDPSDSQRSIANQLVDRIVATNPEYYEAYAQARREADVRRPFHSARISDEALGYFLSRWLDLETVVRQVAETSHSRPYTALPNTPTMMKLGLFVKNEETFHELDQIRRLRNEVVHGVRTLESDDVLYQAGDLLEHLLSRMRSESSQEAQQIIDSSDTIQRILKKDMHK